MDPRAVTPPMDSRVSAAGGQDVGQTPPTAHLWTAHTPSSELGKGGTGGQCLWSGQLQCYFPKGPSPDSHIEQQHTALGAVTPSAPGGAAHCKLLGVAQC